MAVTRQIEEIVWDTMYFDRSLNVSLRCPRVQRVEITTYKDEGSDREDVKVFANPLSLRGHSKPPQ